MPNGEESTTRSVGCHAREQSWYHSESSNEKVLEEEEIPLEAGFPSYSSSH
jgi:hypothetical protein